MHIGEEIQKKQFWTIPVPNIVLPFQKTKVGIGQATLIPRNAVI